MIPLVCKKYLLTKPRKEPIYDWDAYFALMNRNGTLRTKLEKAKQWAEKKEKIKEIKKEKIELSEEDEINIAECQKKIRKMFGRKK